MVEKAASLFDRGEPCGAEANLAKLLAADASWEAANAALQTFGGYSFDAEYDVERKFLETRSIRSPRSRLTSSSLRSPSKCSASRGPSDSGIRKGRLFLIPRWSVVSKPPLAACQVRP
jgi:acyl-CoA dehydrogenase-like protein